MITEARNQQGLSDRALRRTVRDALVTYTKRQLLPRTCAMVVFYASRSASNWLVNPRRGILSMITLREISINKWHLSSISPEHHYYRIIWALIKRGHLERQSLGTEVT